MQHSPWTVDATADPLATVAPFPDEPDVLDLAETSPGHLDLVSRERLDGWAQDSAAAGTPVALQIIDNGTVIARVLANRYRADLERAGLGSGWHGFDVSFPGGLSVLTRHVIEIKRERDGASVAGSPVVIEAASGFDAALEQAVASAVAALGPDEGQERALSFMIAQADRLLQRRADAAGGRTERRVYEQFRRRWQPHGSGMTDLTPPAPSLRALVIDERLPAPDRDAGSHAILSHMRALQRLGYALPLRWRRLASRTAPHRSTPRWRMCCAGKPVVSKSSNYTVWRSPHGTWPWPAAMPRKRASSTA